MRSDATGRLARLRDVALGLLATLGILCLLEGALTLGGVRRAGDSTDWSRGFDAGAQYFRPDPASPGTWVTTYYPENQGQRRVPPAAGRERVILFGGSNTAGFPGGVLEQELNERSGRKRMFQVVNLGRSGYGSVRVRILFQQALELLRPDAVVIYAGHNEFVERGFELDLEQHTATPRLVRDTRLFAAFLEVLRPAPETRESPQKDPDAWTWEYDKFRDLAYPETLRNLAAFGENVEAMARAARERGVRVVVCTAVYNRLAAPFSSTLPPGLAEPDRVRYAELRAAAEAALPAYLAPLLPRDERARIHAQDWGGGDGAANRGDARLESWRTTTGPLSDPDRGLQEERFWSAKPRELDRCLVRFFARDAGGADLARLQETLESVLELVPDDPRTHFELALVLWLRAAPAAEVVRHLEDAARYDRAPRKASEVTNDLVRGVASRVEGVHLFDADAAFAAAHPDGLLGWDWMRDHCHLHYGGYAALMRTLGREVLETWPTATWADTSEEPR